MPIRFRCQDCRSRVKVPEGTQGKQVKCPRCGRVQSVPSPNHDSDHPGRAGDLTVHTLVGSIHKSPKRKEALVGSGHDRFDSFSHDELTGGGVPGGLDIPSETADGRHGNQNGPKNNGHSHGQSNGYRGKGSMSRKQRRKAMARAAQEARLAKQKQIEESRKSVEDLFAGSLDPDTPRDDSGAYQSQQVDARTPAKSLTRPEAIALDGGAAPTAADSSPYTPDFHEQAPVESQARPAPDRFWTLDLTPGAYPFLKMVPWVLRIAALMLIGPAFKGMLVANEHGFSGVVSMLVLFAGLTLVAVTWTVGEIANAVRDIALRRAAG